MDKLSVDRFCPSISHSCNLHSWPEAVTDPDSFSKTVSERIKAHVNSLQGLQVKQLADRCENWSRFVRLYLELRAVLKSLDTAPLGRGIRTSKTGAHAPDRRGVSSQAAITSDAVQKHFEELKNMEDDRLRQKALATPSDPTRLREVARLRVLHFADSDAPISKEQIGRIASLLMLFPELQAALSCKFKVKLVDWFNLQEFESLEKRLSSFRELGILLGTYVTGRVDRILWEGVSKVVELAGQAFPKERCGEAQATLFMRLPHSALACDSPRRKVIYPLPIDPLAIPTSLYPNLRRWLEDALSTCESAPEFVLLGKTTLAHQVALFLLISRGKKNFGHLPARWGNRKIQDDRSLTPLAAALLSHPELAGDPRISRFSQQERAAASWALIENHPESAPKLCDAYVLIRQYEAGKLQPESIQIYKDSFNLLLGDGGFSLLHLLVRDYLTKNFTKYSESTVLDLVKELLSNGANPNLVSLSGSSPYGSVKEKGASPLLTLFESCSLLLVSSDLYLHEALDQLDPEKILSAAQRSDINPDSFRPGKNKADDRPVARAVKLLFADPDAFYEAAIAVIQRATVLPQILDKLIDDLNIDRDRKERLAQLVKSQREKNRPNLGRGLSSLRGSPFSLSNVAIRTTPISQNPVHSIVSPRIRGGSARNPPKRNEGETVKWSDNLRADPPWMRAVHCCKESELDTTIGRVSETLSVSEGVDVNMPNARGEVALAKAILLGDLKIVENLLDRGHLDLNVRNRFGWTPLHFAELLACISGEEKVATRLRNGGALDHPDLYGVSPFELRGIRKRAPALKVDRIEEYIREGNYPLIAALILQGLPIEALKDMVHLAAYYGEEMVALVLIRFGVSFKEEIVMSDRFGLHLYVMNEKDETGQVQSLVNPNSALTAYEIAVRRKHLHVADCLDSVRVQ